MAGKKDLTQIEKLQDRPDPLLSFKWVSLVLPFGLPYHYLESIDIPFQNVKIHEATYVGSGYVSYPGAHEISGFNASFYMDSQGIAMKWIEGWKNRIKDFDTGVYELPSNYKQTWNVELLNTRNESIITLELEGVWPSETSNFSLNYNDNGRLVLTQAFSIDNVDTKFNV